MLIFYTDFIDLLNEMRKGEISPTAIQRLKMLSRPLLQTKGDLLPTELFPLRAQVDRANASRLAALANPVLSFMTRDSGSAPPEKRRKLLDNMTAVGILELKCDAQVMLVKNMSETLVNGSVGRVVDFCQDPCSSQRKTDADKELLPLVEFGTFRGKETVLVSRDEFRAEDGDGNLLARRIQVSQLLRIHQDCSVEDMFSLTLFSLIRSRLS